MSHVFDLLVQVVDRSGGLRVSVYGGQLDSVNGDGLLGDGPLRGVGTGGGLLGGGVGDGLRCGANAELLQLELRIELAMTLTVFGSSSCSSWVVAAAAASTVAALATACAAMAPVSGCAVFFFILTGRKNE